jgi:hypothetical protein
LTVINYGTYFTFTALKGGLTTIDVTVSDGKGGSLPLTLSVRVSASYWISVTGGTGSKSNQAWGSSANINATIPADQDFVRWKIISGTFTIDNPTNPNTTFTMPAENVEIQAIFTPATMYDVTVTNGTAARESYKAGVVARVTADAADPGQRFTGFSSLPSVVFEEVTTRVYTFTMPAEPVEVTANYADWTLVSGTEYEIASQVNPTDPFVINAKTGYTISKTQDGTYAASISFAAVGTNQTAVFYIKNAKNEISKSGSATYSVANTAPVSKNPTAQSVEIGKTLIITADDLATDVNGDTLSITNAVSADETIAAVTNGSFIVSGVLVGNTTVDFTVSDGTDTVVVTLTVNVTEVPIQPQPDPQLDPTPSDNSSSNSSYTPPAPSPSPAPAPSVPESNPYVTPSMDVTETAEGTEFTTASGVTATVTVSEDEGVKVEAGVNESGSVNSQATAAAVAEAAAIAQANGETTVAIDLPEGTIGLSKSTVEKLIAAAGDTEVVVNIPTVVDGEAVGSISVPLTETTGQILTGMTFDTKRTEQIENYVANKWDTEVLGSFETAQKGGWGGTATLTVSIDKLDISADDGTKLYAVIYDTKNKKWYQVEATIEDGNVVIKTKRSGIVTIVTEPVKK